MYFLVRHLPRVMTALLLFALALPVCAKGAGPLVLSAANTAPRVRVDGTGFEDRIVSEACRRAGIPVRLVILPSERAMQNANQGFDDGNYVRIAGLERLYPNLLMVPEPVSEFLFTAFTKNPALRIDGWDGLKPHGVGIITGWKIVEANTTAVRFLTSVKNEEALFSLLEHNRVEVVVMDLHSGLEIIRSKGYQNMRALSPALERRDMFIYLHKRHAELVPKLAEALRAMKRDGTIDRLTKAGLAGAKQ
jgi:polar amino acid transport system substrate-binding protein